MVDMWLFTGTNTESVCSILDINLEKILYRTCGKYLTIAKCSTKMIVLWAKPDMGCEDTLNLAGQNCALIKVDLDQVKRITTNVLRSSINMILKSVLYKYIYKRNSYRIYRAIKAKHA